MHTCVTQITLIDDKIQVGKQIDDSTSCTQFFNFSLRRSARFELTTRVSRPHARTRLWAKGDVEYSRQGDQVGIGMCTDLHDIVR